jgi:hypothetical protein
MIDETAPAPPLVNLDETIDPVTILDPEQVQEQDLNKKTRAGVRPFKKLTIPELKRRLKGRGFERGLSGKRKGELVAMLQKTRLK